MEQQEKPKKKKFAKIFISALVIIAILATVMILRKTDDMSSNADCCATICSEFNQECRGCNADTLQCTFNYEQYGYPEVNEVFTFKINDSMKERLCKAPTAEINDTFEPITNLTE